MNVGFPAAPLGPVYRLNPMCETSVIYVERPKFDMGHSCLPVLHAG